jgi:hypothetical protein
MVTIEDLDAGTLFKYGNTYALKTEYCTEKGICKCFIVGSGEMFWGGVSNPNELLVEPVNLGHMLEEIQWLYGRLNMIENVIESGRNITSQFE